MPIRQPDRNTQRPHIFADHALELYRHGLAVIPLAMDRKPYVSGFNKWKHAPGHKTVEEWTEQFPDANIGVLPGLTRTSYAAKAVVFDGDNRNQIDQIKDIVGDTPLRDNTSRGQHLWYRAPKGVEEWPNLRKYGLEADIQAGNALVIVPPSIHHTGIAYTLDDGCDWSMLHDLPEPNLEKLRKFAGRSTNDNKKRDMRDGSRRQWLNDFLCSHATACDTFDELLDVARTENLNLAERGFAMLGDDIVIERTAKVWADAQAGKLETWRHRTRNPHVSNIEIDLLCRRDPRNGPDGITLLLLFRSVHTTRCQRGETFGIVGRAMEVANVIPGWPRARYEVARDLLLQCGLIEMVVASKPVPGEGRIAAQYRLQLRSCSDGTEFIPNVTTNRPAPPSIAASQPDLSSGLPVLTVPHLIKLGFLAFDPASPPPLALRMRAFAEAVMASKAPSSNVVPFRRRSA